MGLMPYVRPKYLDDDSVLAVGYQLFFYAAGTTTKQDTYSDASLAAANPNPIILNTRGEPDNAGTPIDVYLTPGLSYKVVLATDTDNDPPTSPKWTVDSVTDQGGGGGGGGAGQWLTGANAVYASDATFFLSGVDLTADFHVGRRVWLSGGQDRYGVISVSSFGIDTSVTLVDITDAINNGAVLDPAMTTATLSIQRVDGNQGIHFRFYPGTDTGVTNYEFPVGDLRRYGAKMDGVDDATAFGSCVAAVIAGGLLFVPDGIAVIQPETINKEINFIGTGTLKLQANSDNHLLTLGAGSDGTTIKSITLDANRAAQTTDGSCVVVNSGDIEIEGTHIRNASDGVMVSTVAANDVKIHNNHFSGCSLANINVQQDASEVSITDNSLTGANYGVRVLQAKDVTISNNNIQDFILEGIEVSMLTTFSDGTKIINNTITNKDVVSTGDGITVSSSNNTIISHNILNKIKNKAIVLDRFSVPDPACIGYNVSNNIIIEPAETGIEIGVTDQGLVVDNVLVTNNVSNNGIAIIGNSGAGGADNIVCAHNTIGECVVLDFDAAGAGTNKVLGENVLSTGEKRYGDMVFSSGVVGVVNGNYSQIGGFSGSSIRANNFYGVSLWASTSSNSLMVVFASPEPDLDYSIVVPVHENIGSYQITSKTTGGFRLVRTDGTHDNGDVVHWFLYRYPP